MISHHCLDLVISSRNAHLGLFVPAFSGRCLGHPGGASPHSIAGPGAIPAALLLAPRTGGDPFRSLSFLLAHQLVRLLGRTGNVVIARPTRDRYDRRYQAGLWPRFLVSSETIGRSAGHSRWRLDPDREFLFSTDSAADFRMSAVTGPCLAVSRIVTATRVRSSTSFIGRPSQISA